MTEQMTLEQIRDKLRKYADSAYSYFNKTGESLWLETADELADVIDAHLNAAKGEAVAWTVVGPDGKTSIGGWHDMRFFESIKGFATLREGHKYAFAYTHPAPPDVVRDAKRFQFMLDEHCCVERTGNDYWLWWPMTETVQEGSFKSAREAIDAAKAVRENKS